jgi:DNA-binding SARP family transcriptional activator
LVRRQPLRERLRAQLMLALYRAGRQTEALGVYQDFRHGLSHELGLDPSPELQQLELAILARDASLDLVTRAVASNEPPAASPGAGARPRARRRRVALAAVLIAAAVGANAGCSSCASAAT